MTTINLENLYRGVIHEDQRYYLAARLNTSSGSSALIKSRLGLEADADPHFLLCLNRYQKAGIEYHRLYWSNDPVDFVEQFNSNDQNQGAVKLFYKSSTRSDFNIFYKTNLNYQKFDKKLTSYGLDNIEKTTDIDQQRNNAFNIVTGFNQNYNIDNQIHSGVVYNINSITNDGQDWNFRQDVASGSSARPPLATFTNNNNNAFESLKAKEVKVSGTPTIDYANSQLSLSGFTKATGFSGLNDIPVDGGIGLITQGTNSEYFTYTKYNNDTNYLVFGQRAMFGSTSFSPTTGGGTLTFSTNISNDQSNFSTIKEILTTNFSATTSYLDIFFIPVGNYTFFTGGHSIDTITNYDLSSATGPVEFYNYENGKKLLNGTPKRDLSFLTNYINNSLPPNFSPTKMDTAYPLIPVYSTGSAVNSSSTVLWTTMFESMKSYYYNYCRGDDLCGNCMGITETRAYYCHTNIDTLDNYKASTVAGNLNDPNSDNPLSSTPRNSQTGNILRNYLGPLITGCIIIFVFIVMLGVYITEHKKSADALRDILMDK